MPSFGQLLRQTSQSKSAKLKAGRARSASCLSLSAIESNFTWLLDDEKTVKEEIPPGLWKSRCRKNLQGRYGTRCSFESKHSNLYYKEPGSDRPMHCMRIQEDSPVNFERKTDKETSLTVVAESQRVLPTATFDGRSSGVQTLESSRAGKAGHGPRSARKVARLTCNARILRELSNRGTHSARWTRRWCLVTARASVDE
jgi:hypothetical protein